MDEINTTYQKPIKQIELSDLPIELSRYIYEFIPNLHCSLCYKKLINYDKCYIRDHVRIRQTMFCSYYCAIRNKYNKYMFFFQWNLFIIAFRINIILCYLIIVPYIIIHLFFSLLCNLIKMLVLGTF
jgi:hypothetical protein